MADAEADRRLPAGDRDRFRTAVSFADDLPFGEGSIDAAVSSFVLQLVPSRARALREVRRILRPGGHLAFVTWLEDERPSSRIASSTRSSTTWASNLANLTSDRAICRRSKRAANELRRAGFRDVTADGSWLAHAFTVDGYIAFMTEFDEASLFDEMEPAFRERVLGRLRERLARLSPDELTMRFPIVFASGRR